MKKLLATARSGRLALLVCTVTFLSCADEICEDEGTARTTGFYFWSPNLSVEKGDGEALLLLSDPTPYTQYAGPSPTHPDFFNILLSEDLETFTLYKRVDYRETMIRVENLTNDRHYYFKIAAEKGKETQDSNIVMTIPSQELPMKLYQSGEYPYKNLSQSHDGSYISFVKNDAIHFASIEHGGQPFVDENSGGASWSQESNKAVYSKYKQQGITLYTSQFKVFDPATNIATELFQISYDGPYTSQPKFIPASNDISFWSTEENSDEMGYDLWRINPDTKEKTRMTNMGAGGFIGASNYKWTDTGSSIYIDGLRSRHEPRGIFRFDFATNALSPVITSLWNDQRPSLSPADTKIAFVSDRSGRDEIWMYDMTVKSYQQVTGHNAFYFDSRDSNLQWLDESQLLITVWLDDVMATVTINVD